MILFIMCRHRVNTHCFYPPFGTQLTPLPPAHLLCSSTFPSAPWNPNGSSKVSGQSAQMSSLFVSRNDALLMRGQLNFWAAISTSPPLIKSLVLEPASPPLLSFPWIMNQLHKELSALCSFPVFGDI